MTAARFLVSGKVQRAALFQNDVKNLQSGFMSFTSGGAVNLENAGKARIRGGEIDITARPLRGLTLNAAVGYSDAKLTEDQANSSVLITASTGKKGDRIPGTPPWTASASGTYNWALGGGLNGMVRADYTYTGEMQAAFRPTDPYFTTYGDYSMVNLRTGVEGDRWGAYLFVQNVGNVAGVTGRNSGFGYSNLTFATMPRTVGLNVRFGL